MLSYICLEKGEKMNVEKIKECLPVSSVESFDNIVYGKVLGASNHIKMIATMFIEIAQQFPNDAEVRIEQVSKYFKETRGKSSYAIITALELIELNIKNSSATEYLKKVEEGVNDYFVDAEKNAELMIKYSDKLLENLKCIMIFDYSSSVEKAVVKALSKLKVYVPESRAINGGYPFIEKIVNSGHEVYFIPDAAMLTVLKEVEMVFIGAETFYPDGTAFNTVGSDILAELCKIYHVPYYVITPLLKADIRSIYGQYKEVIASDLKHILTKNWPIDLTNKVNFHSIELVGVKPELITGFITEKGILKPSDLFQLVNKEIENV
ncbi:MAG: initiation factor 2 [Erysipelotrichales bacterium]|nr:initiation factor 2 [Erysipelotrichales bacterium]